ncbi:MAG: tetratricopeptide repeat protein [Treponema sp.]|nr:tetratricopeptide repeat protein [Treponema sp.]
MRKFRDCQPTGRAGILGLVLFAVVAGTVPADTDALLDEISRLMAGRDFDAALRLFAEIPDDSVEIRLLRASALNAAGRTAEAAKLAGEIVAARPENIDALTILADAAAIEGRDRDQRGFLERILRVEPDNLAAISALGYGSIRSRSLRTAADHFDRALAIDPNHPESLVGRAMIYRYERRPAEAEVLLNRAIAGNPNWAEPLHERARLYGGTGFREDALEDLNRAKALEPDNPWLYIDGAGILMELGRNAEAVEQLDRAIALAPETFLAYVHRATAREALDDPDGAADDYRTVMRLKPDYYFAAESLGVILMKEGRNLAARDAFLAAFRQAPGEFRYALLAAANWIREAGPADPRQFLTQTIRQARPESPEWFLLRLFQEQTGDATVAAMAGREENFDNRAMLLFYLALYHDLRGERRSADNLFLQAWELDRRGTVEWNLNRWILGQRGLIPDPTEEQSTTPP